MKTVGLTGGIGSGKSTAAAILAELGALVIDADRLGHEAYAPGAEGWQRVVDAFGREIVAPDGTIDRKRLGAIVFGHADQLEKLNRIVHPLLAEALRRRIEESRSRQASRPVVVEAAILVEANWRHLVDEVWLVVADSRAIVERVRNQRGLDETAVESRIRAQTSDAERRRHADVVIDNTGSLADLRGQIESLWRNRIAPSGSRPED